MTSHAEPNTQHKGGRKKGRGEGLLVSVATRLTHEEAAALDRKIKLLNFESRSELIRLFIRMGLEIGNGWKR